MAEQKAQYVARGGNPTHEWTAGFAGSARAPGLLWIFGEAGYRALQFDVVVENYQPDRPHGSYPEIQREMRRAARLFPEAKVFDIEPVPRAKYEELKKR